MSNKERYFKEIIIAAYIVLGTVGVISLKRDSNIFLYVFDTIFSLIMYWCAVDDIVKLIRKCVQNDYFDEDSDFEKKTR